MNRAGVAGGWPVTALSLLAGSQKQVPGGPADDPPVKALLYSIREELYVNELGLSFEVPCKTYQTKCTASAPDAAPGVGGLRW